MPTSKRALLLTDATPVAWITQEYHRTAHREIGATPLDRYLSGPTVARESPGSEALRAAFRIEVRRRQRRSDGTVSLEGQRFEIPSRYRHLSDLHLRYARWDLSRVDLIDPHSGAILAPVRPIDKAANAEALRRVLEPVTSTPAPQATPHGAPRPPADPPSSPRSCRIIGTITRPVRPSPIVKAAPSDTVTALRPLVGSPFGVILYKFFIADGLVAKTASAPTTESADRAAEEEAIGKEA